MGRVHEKEVGGGEDRENRKFPLVMMDGPVVRAQAECLPRTPDCWSRNNPENFQQQVYGEHSWGSSQTSVRDLD